MPGENGPASLDKIYNYVPIEGLFPTSGQPDADELQLICDSGYEAVLNLAPKCTVVGMCDRNMKY